MTKKIAVLYHANCPDGFGGAWAAWKKFGNKAEYYPVRYNIEPPLIKNKRIFMIDFCYNEPEFMAKLKKNNESLIVIDHHQTAESNLRFADDFRFEMDHSGATLAWDYFHPKKEPPLFLRHLEDMDLWKFKMKGTQEVSVLSDFLDQDFKVWDRFIKNFENSAFRKKFIEKGQTLITYRNSLGKKIIDKTAELVEFEGMKVYAINTPIFESELGSILYKMKPPMSIMWYRGKQDIKISLRSNGGVDVSKIAMKFGGGGHKGSSGFRVANLSKLPWKSIKIKNGKE